MRRLSRLLPAMSLPIAFAVGCADQSPAGPDPVLVERATPSTVNLQVADGYDKAERDGSWLSLTPLQLWDYVAQSDTQVIVGLKRQGAGSGVRNGEILIRDKRSVTLAPR